MASLTSLMMAMNAVEFYELWYADEEIDFRIQEYHELSIINECTPDKYINIHVGELESIADETHYMLYVGQLFNTAITLCTSVIFLLSVCTLLGRSWSYLTKGKV